MTEARHLTDIAGGIALYDAVAAMPQHAHRRYARRPESAVVRQYHHHSGALGRPGLEGAQASARYVVDHRGWAGMPYHFWLPHERHVDDQGRLVVYMTQYPWTRSWHTGGDANTHGVGVCWQGDLTEREPSDQQIELAEALIPWIGERLHIHGTDSLSWHSEAGRWGGSQKAACPGPHVVAWLSAYRDGM